jgi:hypothetical protein
LVLVEEAENEQNIDWKARNTGAKISSDVE